MPIKGLKRVMVLGKGKNLLLRFFPLFQARISTFIGNKAQT